MSSRNHNSSYWKQRAQALEALEHQNAAQYEQTLQKAFYKASAQMQREIESWYQRFADSEGITLPEAKRLLNTRELEEFRWTVEDYIRAGEENALNGNWLRQLENASAKVHISRLESLQLQLQQKIEQLFQNHLDGLDQLLRQQYGEQYYHAAFELMRGTGVGVSFQRFDESFLDRLIDRPWTADGKTFSDRIWENQGKLLSTLQTELIQAAVLGRAAQKTAKAVAEVMEVSLHRAKTLVYTESAYFSARADRDAYRRLGVEQYEILATLDLRTSEICRQMDGKVFSMGEFEPGITAPPFHPNCRTTTVPYFEDDMGERIARGADGKTYYVPGDMTYREWENKFVENRDLLTNNDSNTIINSSDKNGGAIDVHYVGKIDVLKYQCIADDISTDEVIITDERIAHVKERHPNDYERYVDYIGEILADPDYILEANKPNTAFVLKEISIVDEKFQMIVRLKVSEDPIEYKNSIITFLKISEKKWNKYLRNKKILYRKE